MEIGIYFLTRYRAGEAGYDGRPRGTVAVYHDSSVWLYSQPPVRLRAAFKRALRAAFCTNGEHISGRFPDYTIGV